MNLTGLVHGTCTYTFNHDWVLEMPAPTALVVPHVPARLLVLKVHTFHDCMSKLKPPFLLLCSTVLEALCMMS